jgi:hypothetical protein
VDRKEAQVHSNANSRREFTLKKHTSTAGPPANLKSEIEMNEVKQL